MKQPLTYTSRKLRKDMTSAEQKLWSHLRAKQMEVKFRRQVPIGTYIVDFVSFDARLIVEVDGGQHMGSEADRTRDEWFRTQGFEVLRFWNHQVLKDTEAVLIAIRRTLAKDGDFTPT